MKTINASKQSLGRVASQAAKMLMGKDEASYAPNVAPQVTVQIINASQLKITEKKAQTKIYKHHTGFHGGLRLKKLADVVERKGHKEILHHAIRGMLPANKLRPKMLKNLSIID